MSRVTKIIISAVVIVAALSSIIAWRVVVGNNNKKPRTVTTVLRSVNQDVTFAGQLESSEHIQLGFEVAGKIQAVPVAVGATVSAGQVIARLDSTLAELEFSLARANQSSAEYEKYLAWQKSATDYVNTKATNAQTAEKKRQAVRDAKAELDQDRKVHERTALESGDDSATTQTNVATLKLAESTYHAAQQTLAETIKSINASNELAKDNAAIAYAQYLATKQAAGNVAGLSSLQASRQLAQVKLNKNNLVAPISGIITAVHQKVGEVVTANETILELQTTGNLEITAAVPETDAVKLKVGLPATVTLDAFPTADSLSATVARVAPAAVTIEGVPTYETTLLFSATAEHLRPGLTVNVTVHADRRDNVIAVPRRAVIERDGRQLVRVLGSDSHIAEREVTTGLLGSDGAIEITSGLAANESVIIDSIDEE